MTIPILPIRVHTMAEHRLPLTASYFATEDNANILNNINDQTFTTFTGPLRSVVQARPCLQADQLELSTPHMPRWRRDDGEMLCVLLNPSPINTAPNTRHLLPHTLMREQRRVLLKDMLPLPTQETTLQGGGLDLLVCPPLPRILQMQTVCGRHPTIPANYEEGVRWCVVVSDGGGQLKAHLSKQAAQPNLTVRWGPTT